MRRLRSVAVASMSALVLLSAAGALPALAANSAAATYDGYSCFARPPSTPPDVVLATSDDHATVTTIKGNITVTCTFSFDPAILPGGRVFKTSGWPCVISGASDTVLVTTSTKLVMDTTGVATMKCWAKETASA